MVRTYSGSPVTAAGSKQARRGAQINGDNYPGSESYEEDTKRLIITRIFVALEHELNNRRTRIPELHATIL